MMIHGGLFYLGEESRSRVSYTFVQSKDYPGLFEYQIAIDLNKNLNDEQIREDIQKMLGYTFADNHQGYCTWDDLPNDLRGEFRNEMTHNEIVRAELVARYTIAEGETITTVWE